MDFALLGCAGVLALYGLVFIYSATHQSIPDQPFHKVKLQLVWLAIGFAAMCVTTFADYAQFARFFWPILIGFAAVLAGLLVLGHFAHLEIRGSARWIPLGPFKLQPSEIAKIGLVLLLGTYLARLREHTADLRVLGGSLAILAALAGLILLQPDLGTPVVMGGIWLAMAFAWGARLFQLAAVCLTIAVGACAAWEVGLVTPAQQARLMSFLDPAADPLGAGYHLAQSRAAIGAGGFLGQGLFHGSQTQLRFVPDQDTDFIFTAIAEELGFVGSLVLLALFAYLLWRCLDIAREAKDDFGRLVAFGLTTLFALHVFVNIGMTLGLLPVKGLPLPFVSYGGSNMLTNMIAIGLLQNIWMRRSKITF